ncbi:sin3 histone deacetylase corepressor complex component SDS3 isoform X2 [Oratosquilla oratoria]|uniref:sin3 histone deacetylase corepressor complex component SDS3 isoform X2 n=1 Tax=Oratosquilla oratoria TaxID=337810 RepID=UPI003F76CE51
MSDLVSPKSPGSADFCQEDYDFDDDNDADFEDSRDYEDRESDEDEASEGESRKGEYAGIKEQMYQDKLAQLKKQLQQLREASHPDYNKKLKKIELLFKERLRLNDIWRDLEMENVEREYLAEKRLAAIEFEEKKGELRENLLIELEEKKKIIEQERHTMDLNGDSMEFKPVSTRKLRRRGNEPAPMVEKRRKPVSNTLQLLLDEREVDDDLKLINKSKLLSVKKTHPTTSTTAESPYNEPRIENGRLYFDRKWYQKGQAIMVECKDGTKFNAVLSMAGSDAIMVRKVPDNTRLKITLAQLAHGKYLVRRRTMT